MTRRKDPDAATTASPESGAFAYEGLDRVLHEKARLGILTALITRPDGVGFVDLKSACNLTDGNLARHLQTLQQARLVDVEKVPGERGQRPQTNVQLTSRGRRQFLDYLGELERVIRDAKGEQVARDDTAVDPTSSGRRKGGGLAPA